MLDEFCLDDIGRLRGSAAGVLVPFVVERLATVDRPTSTLLLTRLLDIAEPGQQERFLRLYWSKERALDSPAPLPARVVTELAACGVACAVVWVYGGLTITQVTAAGDCFDYWVSAGEREYGLEVSGTTGEDLWSRHREKVHQLRRNPYGVDGYVLIVGFARREVVFSFHRAGEVEP